MQEQIQGTTMPVLSILLNPGESVVAEAGEFSWMTDTIQMSTGMGGGMAGRGLMGALKRAAGGATLMMSTYTAQGGPGTISFAAKMPGSILPVDVGPGAEFMVHRHGFLAGTPGIQLTAGFQQSFRAGIFAGEGFILQRAGGQGRMWTELSGEVVPFAVLSGPGTVWLQSMPLPLLAASLAPYLPDGQDRRESVESGVVGGIIGDMLH